MRVLIVALASEYKPGDWLLVGPTGGNGLTQKSSSH